MALREYEILTKFKDQRSKIKNKNDRSKSKNVVRGFSLVPRWDCTTLKGRTTIIFGISSIGLPRNDSLHSGPNLPRLHNSPSPSYLKRVIQGLPRNDSEIEKGLAMTRNIIFQRQEGIVKLHPKSTIFAIIKADLQK